MKNNTIYLDRISNTAIFMSIVVIFFLKIALYFLLKNQVLNIGIGGGNDSDYYNAYAKGFTDVAVNVWPVILKFLNDIGLYSRDGISYLFLFLNLLVIPHVIAHLSGLSFKDNQKYYLYSFLICLIYPTLFFYTLDVYRDLFMVVVFIVGCFFVKKFVNSSNLVFSLLFFFISILIGFFLSALRPYLGYTFLISIFLWKIKFTKKRLFVFLVLYFIALFAANYLGLFSVLTEYRTGFEKMEGGSNLGLDFSNPVMFIPNFILSILGQLLGLYITNPLSIILLLIETLPFLLMLIYIIRNIGLADNFVRFLIIFFVLYASVWLIGNDNLGTAVRLRMCNYIAIYISFFYILRLKKLSLQNEQAVKK